ncbi:MAG TPA: glycine cleavage system aminomethyltransferase GcvT [Candidatus Omnitrophota bacterium]|nr:glycine cleavage system aminomethyltransferase GcvT [Candidatus Omnitrophota bacterium]HPT07139.1 glycine cleavage system aminomethyltransferase GcvT [Candidatus Omnitrophota bacterium]
METKLLTTPLFLKHQQLHAQIAPFSGWSMPIQYEGILAEHVWTRTNASVFDICHMGEFLLTGTFSESGLDKVVTMRLDDMVDGECRYGFMLNKKAGIIDDLVVYRIAVDQWMLVVNAGTTPNDEANLRKNLTAHCRVENISNETAKLDVQGPLARKVLEELVGRDVRRLAYYRFSHFHLLGEHVLVSRTGYTGELGYEIYITASKAEELWDLILKNPGVKPAGLGCRDTLRLEMCYPLYGHDIDEVHNPLEAGLGRFVYFGKEFIGSQELMKIFQAGPQRRMAFFKADSRRAPRQGYAIRMQGKDVGVVTSGSFSPSLSCGIAMGYVESEWCRVGLEATLAGASAEISSTSVEKPFYKRGSARSEGV